MKRTLVTAVALASCLGVVGATSAITAAPAYAAGSGYTPGGGGSPGTATGLPGSVVSSTTIQPSGGTATATVGSATVTVTVPAGAFSAPVQCVITDASSVAVSPASGKTVVTFGVGFYMNGSKVTGTFPAVTVKVTSSSITAGSTVYFVTSSGLQAVSGAAVSAGSATITITSDPVIQVVAPVTTTAATGTAAGSGSAGSNGSAPGAIAGATSGQTGEPFLLEGGLAAALVLLGAALLLTSRLRRRPA